MVFKIFIFFICLLKNLATKICCEICEESCVVFAVSLLPNVNRYLVC